MNVIGALKDVFRYILDLLGMFVDALVSSEGDLHSLLPVFVIGIGVSIFLLGIKAVKSMTWGA